MTIEQTKIAKTIGIIVGVIVVATGIQFARFRMKLFELTAGQGAVFPVNYFPFNGTYIKNEDGLVTKQ